jgi:Superfamily I DNA and RNA helicases
MLEFFVMEETNLQPVPQYSVLLFYDELPKQLNQLVKYRLHNGIRVYLFTMDSLENYETNPDWIQAREYGFLEWHEIRFEPIFSDKSICFYDGIISDDQLYGYLKKQCPDFNYQQYEVIHAPEHMHVLLHAGAGTGKTTTMIERLLFLKNTEKLKRFSDASLITFTNEAARTIRERLLKKVNNYFLLTRNKKFLKWAEDAESMQISTIHSFASSFIKPIAHFLHFRKKPEVVSCRFKRKLLCEKYIDKYAKEHMEDFKPFKHVPQYEIVRLFEGIQQTIKNKSLTLRDLTNMEFGSDADNLCGLLKYLLVNVESDLDEYKKENGYLEVNDLIAELANIKISEQMSDYFPEIKLLMIDEFQDTDEAQVEFVSRLVDKLHVRLFVVGDNKQSIYRFRGADYTAFHQLKEKLDDQDEKVMEYTLTLNYRSTKTLLNEFDSMFTSWGKQISSFKYYPSDKLRPVRNEHSEGLTRVQLNDANFEKILARMERKNDTAVLVRTNHDVDDMIHRIQSLGFYCEGIRKGNFFRTLAVREFYILIKALINPMIWPTRYALHMCSYGSERLQLNDIFHHFSSKKQYLKGLIEQQPESHKFRQLVNQVRIFPVMPTLIKYIRSANPAENYRQRIYSKMRQQFPERNNEEQQHEAFARFREYALNLEKLIVLINESLNDQVATLIDLEHYLSINILTNSLEKPATVKNQVQRIKVMTVHQSKGEEYENVILPIMDHSFLDYRHSQFILKKAEGYWHLGFSATLFNESNEPKSIKNDIFNHLLPSEKSEIIGEETRLLYVALTRAKDRVFANAPDQRLSEIRPKRWSQLIDIRGEKFVPDQDI